MAERAILCTLSSHRTEQIFSDLAVVDDLLEAPADLDIPGLLDLGTTWDALDLLLSERGEHPLLGDAILARTGQCLPPAGCGRHPRVLDPDRVARITTALAEVPEDLIPIRYPDLFGRNVQGNYGQSLCAPDAPEDSRTRMQRDRIMETAELDAMFRAVWNLYDRASRDRHGMLSLVG